MLPGHFHNKQVLMLQGPIGPYFARLAAFLRAQGATVTKLNFNGGDALFFPSGQAYRGTPAELPAFIEALVPARRIDIILLFGDCRPVHEFVHEIARRNGVELRVFEEGYLRPDYITCERHGVNGYSAMPRSAAFYRARPERKLEPARPVGKTYWHMAAWAVLYYLASSLLKPWYPHYQHHRPLGAREGLPWIRSAWRKLVYRVKEAGAQEDLCRPGSAPFYLVPLQVHNDAQVTVHSRYGSVAEFIREVIQSYAAHAPKDTLLVLKHHPMDRAYQDYTHLIQAEASAAGVSGRVRYLHDQHLPTLLAHARGAVVINSTVGLSAVHQGVPTKVCGDAIYDFAGLTCPGTLDAFWCQAVHAKVDMALYHQFQHYLLETSQINGSFYRAGPARQKSRLPGAQPDARAVHHRYREQA